MKKYITILSFLISTILLVSCNDMLDAEDDGRIEFEEIFSNQYKIEDYYMSCLSPLVYPDLRSASFSDEAQHSSYHEDNGTILWYTGQINTDTYIVNPFGGDPWSSAYSLIRRCNIFLENIDQETAGLVHDQKEGMKAEVYAMRGYYYWQLAKRYGGVPVFIHSITAEHDFGKDKKSTFGEVVKQIITDCEKALEGPNTPRGYPWDYQDRLAGHLTPAGAQAIMSQAATYAVSPLWDDGTISKEYATRITGRALYECLSHGYELFDKTSPEAQNAYALYFLTLDDRRAIDKETIYRVGGQMGMWNDCGLPSTPGQTSAGHCPTQNIIDSYEMQKTGIAPINGYSDSKGLTPIINAASGYDEQNPYVGRDPRFEASIYYNGAIRQLQQSGEIRDDHYPLSLNLIDGFWDTSIRSEADYFIVETFGSDPYIYTTALGQSLNSPPRSTLTFEYKLSETIPNAQVFYCMPNAAGGISSEENIHVEATTEWKTFEFDLDQAVFGFGWGSQGDRLRIDLGTQGGRTIYLRNLQINVTTPNTGNTVETYAGGTDGILDANKKYTPTGYYIRKYAHYDSKQGANKDGTMRMIRLAELYLNFAETAYQSHGPDTKIEIGPGMTMSACDAVNAVRRRAGMPDFPAGMSVTDFEKKYRNERRIELAFEGHRSFDVRRWKILSETDKNISGMRIEKDGDTFSYQRFSFEERKCNTDKFLLFPINKSDVNKILKQTGENWQNPGWDY